MNDGVRISGIVTGIFMESDQITDVDGSIRNLPCKIRLTSENSSEIIRIAFSKGDTFYSRHDKNDFEDTVESIEVDPTAESDELRNMIGSP